MGKFSEETRTHVLSSKHHLSSFNSTENSPCFLQCPTQLHQEIHPQQARTLCWLSFCIPDFKNKPQKKASFCLRVQSLRICFATVGEQLEHSPQATPPQSPLLYTPTQNGCRHAPNPTPGIQPDFSVTLYFPKTNGFCLLLFEELCSHLMHVCAMLRLRGQPA